MAGTVFIFGLGYVGRPLGHRLAAAGWQVRGTTRTPSRLAAQAEAGWQIHEFADDRPLADPDAALDGVDALITTITAIGGSDPVLDAHGELIADFKGWSGYVSATSVYPDTPDGFCYEDTPTGPATARGRARVEAEQRWLDLLGTEIFRAAGIYGPGRSPFDALRDGTSRIIEHRGQVFNRIHVEDIARALDFLGERHIGGVFNVTDDLPAPPQDVVEYAASLMKVDLPPAIDFETATISPMARSFYGECKRVSNAKLKQAGFAFAHSDYKTALSSMWAQGNWH